MLLLKNMRLFYVGVEHALRGYIQQTILASTPVTYV